MSELPETRVFPYRIVAASVAVLAFCMAAAMLRSDGLWIDEMYTLNSIQLPVWDMVRERLSRAHLPGYFLMLKGWFAATGLAPSEVSLRLPSLIAFGAALLSFWSFAFRALAAGPAALSVGLFALNGIALRQAVEARMYAFVLLMAVWALRAYWELMPAEKAEDSARRPVGAVTGTSVWSTVLIGSIVAAFCFSPSVPLLLIALSADAFRRRRTDSGKRQLRVVALSVAAVIVIALVALAFRQNIDDESPTASLPLIGCVTNLSALFTGVFTYDDHLTRTGASKPLLLVSCCATIVLCYTIWRERERWSALQRSFVSMLAATFLILFVTKLIRGVVPTFPSVLGPARYLVWLVPAAALLVASILYPALQRIVPRWRVLTLAAGFAVLAWSDIYTLDAGSEYAREVLHKMKDDYRPGETVICVPDQIAAAVEMYVPGAKVSVPMKRFELDAPKVRAMMEPLRKDKAVWLFWYRGKNSPVIKLATELYGPAKIEHRRNKNNMIQALKYYPMAAAAQETSSSVIAAAAEEAR